MILETLQNSALKLYNVNSKLNDGRRLYFNAFLFSRFIEEVSLHFKVSSHFDLNHAFSRSTVRGLINSLFDANESYFNALDLSVAINIGLNGFCNEKDTDNGRIADSANYICEGLRDRLYNDRFLKEYLDNIDKGVDNFHYQVDKNHIKSTLENKELIFRTYFDKFNKSEYSTSIRIFHQETNNTWLNWKCENSLLINHHLVRFRLGFFLPGFDYQIENGARLRVAIAKKDYEYFNPSSFKFGKDVIWAQ
jgi:hypothetical protein